MNLPLFGLNPPPQTDKRTLLWQQLAAYVPTSPEQTSHFMMLRLLESSPDCFERKHFNPGHFTASGWVTNPNRTKVLLMHHKKLNNWLQPGGHADGNPNLQAVAHEELWQEVMGAKGIEREGLFQPQGQGIFDIDVHLFPAKANAPEVPSHLHYDVRYLYVLDDTLPIPGNAESAGVRWFSFAELEHMLPVGGARWRMLNKLKAQTAAT
jgi:hypothetical protein